MVRFLGLTDSLKLVLSTTYPLVSTKHMALLPKPLPQGLKEGHQISRERRSEGEGGVPHVEALKMGSTEGQLALHRARVRSCTSSHAFFPKKIVES